MTRKKTTTGTMGSKRKADTRQKERPATDKARSKDAEHKANEVIPEVACALLETHPTLPDRAMILDQFAGHFRAAKEKAAAEAAEAEEAAARSATEAAERDRSGQRKKRPTIEPVSRQVARPPISRPISRPHTPQPAQVAAIVAAAAPTPEPAPVSMFAELEAEAHEADSADLLSLLHDAPAARADEDFDFSYQTSADQSSPFAAAPIEHTPLPDEGATVMRNGVEDDSIFGTPIALEALASDEPSEPIMIAPHESTTMLQAMPDDEPAEAEGGGRKSRKSSKKRRG